MAKKIKINLDEKSKIVLVAAGIALVTFIVCTGVIKSCSKKSVQARTQIVEETKRLALRKGIANADKIKGEYEKRIYKRADTFALRDTISNLARDAGVNIIAIQPQPQEKIGSFTKISFNLKLRCSYNELGNFLAKMENLTEFTKVENLNASIVSYYSERAFGDATGQDMGPKGESASEVTLTVSLYSTDS